jgi:iron complex transport system permease protein
VTANRSRGIIVGVVLGALLLVAILLSALLGQVPISAKEVIGSVLQAFGIQTDWAPGPADEALLWIIRFPRIVMAIAVGAALAVAGAVMQAIFGNPLAEPGVVGVSSGSALGASIAIIAGLAAFGDWTIAAAAFGGALLATLLVYAIARANGRTEVVTLLLTGIAVNAFAGAGVALTLFVADMASREQIIFWQLGSLNVLVFPAAVIGTIIAILLARRYDLLALGERNARHLGVDVERLRIGSIVLVAVLTGAAVAFVGIIAFVGLVVPHIVRMLLGPSHRGLIVTSAFGGALLIVVADMLARLLVPGGELPIGLLTSLVGGPFFLFLLWQQRRRSGGWA